MSDQSPRQKDLAPFKYFVEYTSAGWEVRNKSLGRALCTFPDERTAVTVALTLRTDYDDAYETGWMSGFDVGSEVTAKEDAAIAKAITDDWDGMIGKAHNALDMLQDLAMERLSNSFGNVDDGTLERPATVEYVQNCYAGRRSKWFAPKNTGGYQPDGHDGPLGEPPKDE